MTAEPDIHERLAPEKAEAQAWFEGLRDDLCSAFEGLEDELAATAMADRPAGRFDEARGRTTRAAAGSCR
jgi:coproporphyrinogen III oxidase